MAFRATARSGNVIEGVVPRRNLTPAKPSPPLSPVSVPPPFLPKPPRRFRPHCGGASLLATDCHPSPQDFQVDFLITPDLGGTMTMRNLWPEPYGVIMWNARVKDRLELKLKSMVCSGTLNLPTAQRDLAANWIAAYKKYLGGTGALTAPRSMALLVARLELRPSRY